MATVLTKDVTRETVAQFTRKGRKLMVSLGAGDVVITKEKGARTKFEVPVLAVHYMGMILKMEELYQEKLEAYKIKKALGQRAKRPKKPPMVFNSRMYKSLEAALRDEKKIKKFLTEQS